MKKSEILFLLAMLFFPFLIWAQEEKQHDITFKHFDGFYVGTSIGAQNIFGGALINDLDVLAQKSGLVLDFLAGYRMQLLQNRLMVGAEIFFGLIDGDLEEVDTRYQMAIFYKNNSQFGWGLQAGGVLGNKKNVLLYIFANETRRNFDINFTTDDNFIHTQEDTQNFVRYGLGIEFPVFEYFNIRANVANTYVDYDDLETSMDVDDKLDYNIGFILNF